MKIKSRHHLKGSESKKILKMIEPFLEDPEALRDLSLEVAETDHDFDLILLKGRPVFMMVEDRPFFTVRGALEFAPKKKMVIVDSGAVSFIVNGADVMAPGIVEADPGIAPGDPVVIVEERHRKPLAIGVALLPGPEMRGSGKAVKSVHHVGDDLWDMSG
ncbi:MAG: RNA-binding protein [Methanothrix sp.]|jgi:PUA domain protein|uniref:PUA domain protein n=1 Tax=Methanothrix harundinacea TaxID=301375 RepID=A0A117MDA8_9EURY|nr:MAG: RNA-binding protein [Methanosaeta sp. SDB]KUK45378.1 MAG: PUA domain protein [Methanothrix harundinacea]MDD3709249.1 RNA-binding protein [Methanothrix sp.]MDI9399666.1 RNA-binding protein [Euryarchaeota archaeon]KUK97702.1 MAG: PUA domain protein [Methanothrix harundinacea]